MGTIRISDLPQATVLDGTEEIPLVQGGTTKRVTSVLLGAVSSGIGQSQTPWLSDIDANGWGLTGASTIQASVLSASLVSLPSNAVITWNSPGNSASLVHEALPFFDNLSLFDSYFFMGDGNTAIVGVNVLAADALAYGFFKDRANGNNIGAVQAHAQGAFGSNANANLMFGKWVTGTTPTKWGICKSNGTSPGAFGAVSSDTSIFEFDFNGSDGTAFRCAASMRADIDGTPGANDMPGKFVFATTPDGAQTCTDRLQIRADGGIIIGTGTVSPSTGSLRADNFVATGSTTSSGLPSAAAAGAGARYFVTNANSTIFGTSVVGGGANAVPVWSDGTDWYIG